MNDPRHTGQQQDECPPYAEFDEDGDDMAHRDRHDSRFAEGVFVGAALVWLVLVIVAAVVLL